MVTTRDCDEWTAVDRGADHPNHEKAASRLSLMAVVAAIFFGQSYLVRELLAAEAFFVFAFLGVTVVVGAVYLIGSVTMSWWAQGKPDVEEIHAGLSEGSIDS